MARFLNPYNFVRMLAQPHVPTDPEASLLWRCPPPPHDRYTGLSGCITCHLTAVTPLFVSDSTVVGEDNKHRTYRFFNVNSERMIPGTSLRGAIRAIFEAATNSTFGVFDERENGLFYRMAPESALGLVPAIVEKDEQENLRLRLLPGFLKIEPDSKNLYAAWIPQYPNEEILQKPDARKHKHYIQRPVAIPRDCQEGVCWAAVRKTSVRDAGFPHHQVDFLAKEHPAVEAWIKQHRNFDYSLVQGYVYLTGLNIDRKQYERFFFLQPNQAPFHAAMSEDVIEAYNSLMRDYHHRKEEIKNSLTSQSESSRPLKPSKFITGKTPRELQEGSLVYARIKLDGNNFEATALYPVNVPRAAYKTSAGDLLYASYNHLLPNTDIQTLCLASRLFGWVSQDADENDLEKPVAYKGRIQFSEAVTTKYINAESITLQILGTPHPTSTEFYLQGADIKQRPNRPFGYDTPGARLRGRKFYRQHRVQDFNAAPSQPSELNRTIEDPAGAGSEFTFHIDFQNLQPVELGALLWTLELHNDVTGKSAYHRLGYAKPLGFGSVQITITDLSLIDLRHRYSTSDGLSADTSIPANDRIAGYKARFKRAFLTLYQSVVPNATHFEDLLNIADLFALLCEPDGNQAKFPIQYPRLHGEEEGFKWFMDNRDQDRPQLLGPAVNDPGLT